MHQPAAQPRPSLYYDYRVFDTWHPGAESAAPAPVVIVGAGPVGLTLALMLARHGARSVVLEAERQVSEGSRAIVFTRRSLEILQQAGVADAVVAMGLPWRVGHSHFRGQSVFRMEAPHPDGDRFGPLTNLQQQYLEQFLVEAVQRHPLIELRWGQKVLGLADDPDLSMAGDGAVARARAAAQSDPVLLVDTPEGGYRQPAQWVVATDGARSVLRQSLGLRMEGDAYEGRFVIADIRIDLPFPTERLAFFDPDWNPGNTVLMHREPQGLWRIDFQLPPGESPEQALAPQSLGARIDAQLAMVGQAGRSWALDWCSVYSARCMSLPEYRCGRVLLAGDAAHLLPIFGVRGANTGFQDAQNLGWKLALVARGLAPAALLESYSAERVQAAREIIAEAGRSTRFMTPPSHGFRVLRDATLSLALTQDFVGPLFHWRTSRAHDHLDSVLNASGVAGGLVLDDDGRWTDAAGLPVEPIDGSVLPGVQLEGRRWLLDLLDGGFSWLHVAAVGPVPEALRQAAAQARASGVPCRVVALRQSLPACAAVAGADVTAADALGQAILRLGVQGGEASWLVRPDQHVAGRWRGSPSAEQAALAMARVLGQDRPAAGVAPCAPDAQAPLAAAAGASSASANALGAIAAVRAAPVSPPALASAPETSPASGPALETAALEEIYDELALMLDACSSEQRERQLVKLALLLAQRGAQQTLDAAAVRAAIAAAAAD